MPKNLVKQYENDVIDEKNEEIRDIYEESDRIESDAEYGQYANDEEVKEYCSKDWNGMWKYWVVLLNVENAIKTSIFPQQKSTTFQIKST